MTRSATDTLIDVLTGRQPALPALPELPRLPRMPGVPITQAGDWSLEDFPRRLQYDTYSCAARSAKAVLDFYGVRISFPTVKRRLGTDSDGTCWTNLPPLFRELGFRVGTISAGRKADLERAIRAGAPVICSVTPSAPHAVAVHGFGPGRIYVADPSLLRRGFTIGAWRDFAREWEGLGYAIHWKRGCAARRQGRAVEWI